MAEILGKLGLKKNKKKNLQKEQERRKLATRIQVFVVINVLLAAGLILYTYYQFLQYSQISQVVATNEGTIATQNVTLKAAQAQFKVESEAFESQRNAVLKDLEVVFPKTEAYTELTRQLDQFFFDLNSANPPIVHNNLRFDDASESEDGGYFVLPFSMSIQSSRDNFDRFLEHVEESGTIGSNTRLMSIESIQINFIEPSEAQVNEFNINFTVSMKAYFQK